MVGYAHAIVSTQSPIRIVSATDLVGCRYRLVQRRKFPEVPRTRSALMRWERLELARRIVHGFLPSRPSLGDDRSKRFMRIDIPPVELGADTFSTELATLEAIAAQASLITGAVFTGESAGQAWWVDVDILVLRPDGTYLPVIISNHRVARASQEHRTPIIATSRLGLGESLEGAFRLRHHVADGYRLGLAARALEDLGLDSGIGGSIGQDRSRAFLAPTATLQPALTTALAAALPQLSRRVKECASCRFWPRCETELIALDDISLFLPGDRARTFREKGINTVEGLINARLGSSSELAQAWRDNVPLLRKEAQTSAPRAAVEIDVDMEAYLDQGAYLWGAYDGNEYKPFVTWSQLGGAAEAENFARFWSWLLNRREQAHAAGKSFAAYCWSAQGENHWMTMSARRFGGQRFGDVAVPSEQEVADFISSPEWIDLFRVVRSQLAGPFGLGLKIVAPVAGYAWQDDDFDGEESVDARRQAVGTDAQAMDTRVRLLRYNEDDCRATAMVRDWLSDGAPGIGLLKS